MHDSAGIVKVVWVPPAYGHAVACVCADGTLSLWEEIVEGVFINFQVQCVGFYANHICFSSHCSSSIQFVDFLYETLCFMMHVKSPMSIN